MKHKIVMRNLFTPRAELLIRLEEARIEREISAKNARIEREHRKANAWLEEVSSEFTGEEYSQEEAKEVFKGCMLLAGRFEKKLHETPTYVEKKLSILICLAVFIIIASIVGINVFQNLTVKDAPVPLRILASIIGALMISAVAILPVAGILSLLQAIEIDLLPEELSRQYRLNLNYWKFVSRAINVAEVYHLDTESLGCSKKRLESLKWTLKQKIAERAPASPA